MRVSLAVLLFVYTTATLHLCTAINPACDCVVYQSSGLTSGRFTSPNFPQVYPASINCILYSFIGEPLEIIELNFIEFDLKMPDPSGRCGDFLRVYMNLERPEVNEFSRHDLEFCGGYSSIQNTVFSAGRSLILEFHSDYRTGKPGNYSGFKGVFQFLDKRNFQTTGSKVAGQSCLYDFNSNNSHHSGRFFSPFYPQHYRPNASCRYRFFARPGERVKVIFSNVQLHHIDASDPYPSIKSDPNVDNLFLDSYLSSLSPTFKHRSLFTRSLAFSS
uniref:CUB domain-containing protein n=1 Tax=Biomphalaria glabrata TaxID=6526 RepID=A0A2C9JM76_BIOGL